MYNSDKPVFLYLLNAYGLFTPGIATMFLMGIFWKRTTHAGALAAGILTIPMSFVMEFYFHKCHFLTVLALCSGAVWPCVLW